ncbi:MAG: UDP-N-acetylmuramate dehydrogenase [Oscillospiraceae bacterium]|nr:UDP-N-acetylmuramate dehydrogenase [Oscillospiraceae bacterium]
MMNSVELEAICSDAGAEMTPQASLAELTTFKIGGPCKALVTLPDTDAAKAVTAYLRGNGIPFYLIGRGSNLLCPDEGYPGVILKLGGAFAQTPVLSEDSVTLRCGAGVSLQKLCQAALEHSLTGLEFAYGIPGTVGGAIYMNAGAYGGEISQVLHEVTVLQKDGEVRTLDAEQLNLGYRDSIFMRDRDRNQMILEAAFTLQKSSADVIREKMRELLAKRKAKQPLDYPSAGSTFKRPAKDQYASRLIDECGLKGYTAGGAQVSEKHAGFVINCGGASFADVMAVCQHVQKTVKEKTGWKLELEPEILKT